MIPHLKRVAASLQKRHAMRDTMTQSGIRLALSILLLVTSWACERQGPPPKPIGSATNKHVEDTAAPAPRQDPNERIQKMKTPMDDARQTEDVLKGAADRTHQQSGQTTP